MTEKARESGGNEIAEGETIGHCSGCNAPLVEFDDGTIGLMGCECESGWS